MAARAVCAVATAMSLCLVGCATDEPTTAVDWANGVCEAAEEVQASVDALGDSLAVDPSSDTDILDQLGEQVSEQTDEVRASIEGLGDAVRDVPEDADPQVSDASDDLDADAASVRDSIDELQDSAQQVADAQGVQDLATAVTEAATALGVTVDQVVALVDDLQRLASEGADAVQDAFAEAPSCEELGSS